jgi:transposase
MALRVRKMTTEENEQIARLARSRTEPARAVERARIILAASQGKGVPAIARQLDLSEKPVRMWLKRFNTQGLAGLTDEPRSGRPATYTAEQVSEVIAAALTKPDALGQPFGSWTLDRLEVYLHEEKGLPIKRSRIDEILIAEGLRWRTQEGWFGERAGREKAAAATDPARDKPVDPEFAQKRGRLRPSTRSRRRAA